MENKMRNTARIGCQCCVGRHQARKGPRPPSPRHLPVGPLRLRFSQRHHIKPMCGRVIQSSGPLRLAILDGLDVRDSRVHNYPPRWNGAPSQELLVIRRNHHTGDASLDPLRWGLIPHFCNDPNGGRKPINAKCETVASLPTFREAYRSRRCILPVDGFFEWRSIKGQKAKQPYAIAMKRRGAVRNWRHLGELERPNLGRVASHLCDHHDGRQRIGGGNPRPNAAHPRARRLCSLVEGRSDPNDLMRPFAPSQCGCGRFRRA